MKYMITWNERSQGSPIEYENAQKRILEVFTQWQAPANFKIEMFVVRNYTVAVIFISISCTSGPSGRAPMLKSIETSGASCHW